MDDFDERMSKLEIRVEAAEEVLVERLVELDARVDNLDKRHVSEVLQVKAELKHDMNELKHDMNSFRSNFSFGTPLMSSSPFMGRGPYPDQSSGAEAAEKAMNDPELQATASGRESFEIPQVLEDVEAEMREKLRPFISRNRDMKEKLSVVQLAFCAHWLSEHRPENARKHVALALREDGIKFKMWGPAWKPGVGDFETYLVEKIKQWLKRLKKESLRHAMKRKANDDTCF